MLQTSSSPAFSNARIPLTDFLTILFLVLWLQTLSNHSARRNSKMPRVNSLRAEVRTSLQLLFRSFARFSASAMLRNLKRWKSTCPRTFQLREVNLNLKFITVQAVSTPATPQRAAHSLRISFILTKSSTIPSRPMIQPVKIPRLFQSTFLRAEQLPAVIRSQ